MAYNSDVIVASIIRTIGKAHGTSRVDFYVVTNNIQRRLSEHNVEVLLNSNYYEHSFK